MWDNGKWSQQLKMGDNVVQRYNLLHFGIKRITKGTEIVERLL